MLAKEVNNEIKVLLVVPAKIPPMLKLVKGLIGHNPN
jgi:hypothetical protein